MSSRSKKTRSSRFPLSPNFEEQVGTVKALIKQGGLVTLSLLFDEKVIRTTEVVDDSNLEEEAVGWDGALRTAPEMEEYLSEGAESPQVLFDMMHIVNSKHLKPVRWAVGMGGKVLLGKWLYLAERDLPALGNDIFNVPLIELPSLPAESLVLCGSKYIEAEPEEITFAVVHAIELRKNNEEDHRACDQCGHHSPECAATAGAVEADSGLLRFVRWRAED